MHGWICGERQRGRRFSVANVRAAGLRTLTRRALDGRKRRKLHATLDQHCQFTTRLLTRLLRTRCGLSRSLVPCNLAGAEM
jgi:hypothetical protein